MKQIAFIGGGNIAEALIKGLIRSGREAGTVTVSDPAESRRDALKHAYGVQVEADNSLAASAGDMVILAVKPGVIGRICSELSGTLRGKLVVSVAAGVGSAALLEILGEDARLVRVMPNTPALVGEGMSALCASGAASGQDLETVQKVFESVGKTVLVPEDQMDAVTALSGSGPAFVFLVIESLADGGVKAGLARSDALLLAAQTVLGAARLVVDTGKHPGELKDMVASPSGTTIEGLHHLEKSGLRGALMGAVTAAARRSRELGGSNICS